LIEDLRQALSDEDERVKYSAVHGLENHGPTERLLAVRTFLKHGRRKGDCIVWDAGPIRTLLNPAACLDSILLEDPSLKAEILELCRQHQIRIDSQDKRR
jgi:hypothetical protein